MSTIAYVSHWLIITNMNTEKIRATPIAQRLEELIQTRHISKSDMARIAGVSRSSVNGWFKRGTISKESASKIAAATGVSLSWVLGEDDSQKNGLTEEEQRLLDIYRQFSNTERSNMVAAFEMRLQEVKDYYARYANPANRK
ncbi:helix-turn-helix transcriptional regulator [Serratia marcescens]|uniref:helix-turn-helix domain-containing protein n=1 Tax=Serratia marcescens TaxID=615 RepID=UPI002FDA6B04